jgi:hypothetical protein
MENGGIFYDHLEYFSVVGYMLWPFAIWSLSSFGIFFPFWYVWTKKNLATLVGKRTYLRTITRFLLHSPAVSGFSYIHCSTFQKGDQMGRIFAYWVIVYFGLV